MSYFYKLFKSEASLIALLNLRLLTDRQARATTDVGFILHQMVKLSGYSGEQICARIGADVSTFRQYAPSRGGYKNYMTVQTARYLISRVVKQGLLGGHENAIGSWMRGLDREEVLAKISSEWRRNQRVWCEPGDPRFELVFEKLLRKVEIFADDIFFNTHDDEHRKLVLLGALDYRFRSPELEDTGTAQDVVFEQPENLVLKYSVGQMVSVKRASLLKMKSDSIE